MDYQQKIVREYRRSISSTDSTRIDYGFAVELKLEDSHWDGDLLDLAISNELVRMIGYQKHINTRRPVVRFEIFGSAIYFTHPSHNSILMFNRKDGKMEQVDLKGNEKVRALVAVSERGVYMQRANHTTTVDLAHVTIHLSFGGLTSCSVNNLAIELVISYLVEDSL